VVVSFFSRRTKHLLQTRPPEPNPSEPTYDQKEKEKQIFPPSPPQTLGPEKTDQTQHYPTNAINQLSKDAPDFIWTTKLVSADQTQHPRNSELTIRSDVTKLNPQNRRQRVQTDQARHLPTIETLQPWRDALDFIRDTSALVKTDQTWYLGPGK
jgi:hypothetical protein